MFALNISLHLPMHKIMVHISLYVYLLTKDVLRFLDKGCTTVASYHLRGYTKRKNQNYSHLLKYIYLQIWTKELILWGSISFIVNEFMYIRAHMLVLFEVTTSSHLTTSTNYKQKPRKAKIRHNKTTNLLFPLLPYFFTSRISNSIYEFTYCEPSTSYIIRLW